MLVLDKATVVIAAKRLLGPVSLTLGAKGITAVLGANGAGKSLFLHLCHGLLLPATGSVMWNGAPAATTRGHRGFVFQHTPVMRRSVAANVEFPLLALGLDRATRQAKVAHILAAAQLDDRADQPAASLSGGERQRMAMARAIVANPKVLILDEPSASLDPDATDGLEAFIRSIAATGTRILFATHDLAQSERLADDIVYFDRGEMTEFSPAGDYFAPDRRTGRNLG